MAPVQPTAQTGSVASHPQSTVPDSSPITQRTLSTAGTNSAPSTPASHSGHQSGPSAVPLSVHTQPYQVPQVPQAMNHYPTANAPYNGAQTFHPQAGAAYQAPQPHQLVYQAFPPPYQHPMYNPYPPPQYMANSAQQPGCSTTNQPPNATANPGNYMYGHTYHANQ